MSDEVAFGARIRALRKGKQLDQRTLAERVEGRLRAEGRRGFDVTYLSKIENGRLPPPSTAAIIHLAHELGADADELLALAGKAPPELGQILKQSPAARTFFRSTRDLDLTEEDWGRLLEHLRRRKGQP